MTTTRFDHTDCSHLATPQGRARCREARRSDIRRAQAAHSLAWETNATPEIQEYEAIVDLFAMRWGMDLRDAYDLIENGPVIH